MESASLLESAANALALLLGSKVGCTCFCSHHVVSVCVRVSDLRCGAQELLSPRVGRLGPLRHALRGLLATEWLAPSLRAPTHPREVLLSSRVGLLDRFGMLCESSSRRSGSPPRCGHPPTRELLSSRVGVLDRSGMLCEGRTVCVTITCASCIRSFCAVWSSLPTWLQRTRRWRRLANLHYCAPPPLQETPGTGICAVTKRQLGLIRHPHQLRQLGQLRHLHLRQLRQQSPCNATRLARLCSAGAANQLRLKSGVHRETDAGCHGRL